MEAKYLKVTMYDNDFSMSLFQIGNLLYDLFKVDGFPEEEDFPELEDLINHMWYATHNISNVLEGRKQALLQVFTCHLEFVDFFNIPNDCNGESIFIPMFKSSFIIRR